MAILGLFIGVHPINIYRGSPPLFCAVPVLPHTSLSGKWLHDMLRHMLSSKQLLLRISLLINRNIGGEIVVYLGPT